MINKIKIKYWVGILIVLISCIPFNQSKGQHILPAHQGSSYVPLNVSTSRITKITNTTAEGWVEISGSLNNATTKGVCWSATKTTPDITDFKGTYTGSSLSFSVNITGMTKNQTYYVRAFVTYGSKTVYGSVISFITGNNGFTTDGKVKFVTMSTPGGVYSDNESQLTQQTNPGFGNSISSGIVNISVVLDFTNRSTLTSAGINVTSNGENFSIVNTGFFIPSESGIYTFTCEGDDAVDLRVDGIIVASHYGGHPVDALGTHTGTISLTRNTKYSFEARMQEFVGQEGLRIFWRRPSQSTGWFQNTSEVSSY